MKRLLWIPLMLWHLQAPIYAQACQPGFLTEASRHYNEPKLRIEVNKATRRLGLFHGLEDVLLLYTPVAIGGNAKDHSTGEIRNFGTPSGKYYIKRIVQNPWWYPPSWAEETKPLKPGTDNHYGLWMAELCRDKRAANHGFSVSGDSKIRLHSTNEPASIGQDQTHGCVRLHPDIAEELFRFILCHYRLDEGKKNARGIVYPLREPILIEIK
jgi:lipoprotein-anchoring transpeptidase ErfK/SrfK